MHWTLPPNIPETGANLWANDEYRAYYAGFKSYEELKRHLGL